MKEVEDLTKLSKDEIRAELLRNQAYGHAHPSTVEARIAYARRINDEIRRRIKEQLQRRSMTY